MFYREFVWSYYFRLRKSYFCLRRINGNGIYAFRTIWGSLSSVGLWKFCKTFSAKSRKPLTIISWRYIWVNPLFFSTALHGNTIFQNFMNLAPASLSNHGVTYHLRCFFMIICQYPSIFFYIFILFITASANTFLLSMKSISFKVIWGHPNFY